jgi:hypothetical protein
VTNRPPDSTAQQGLLEIFDATEPEGEPQLGLYATEIPDLPEKELERIDREMSQAGVLLEKATKAQTMLLGRFAAAAAPDGTLRFPFVATLRRFLAATRSLDDAAAAALSDDALAELWRAADER